VDASFLTRTQVQALFFWRRTTASSSRRYYPASHKQQNLDNY